MSLTSALFTGVSGLSANGDAMGVIGNNISNVNTVGYKTARTVFSDMLSETKGANAQVGRGVQMQAVQNLFSQGSSQSTESLTDLSLQGNGFFAVKDTGGNTYLTRAGAFHLDGTGNLVNPDGLNVLDTAGAAINLGVNANITKIDTTGAIYLNSGATASAKVGVANVTDTSQLQKVGGSLYQQPGAPTIAAATSQQQILSNSLEQSNVDMASEFVKMIVTQRAYSANSKTITTTDQMTQEVLGLIR